MKRFIPILLFLLVPIAVRAQQKKALSAASSTCTATSCLTVTVDQTQGGATFTISNAAGNTIQFEASGDGGATIVSISATPSNSSTTATSTTSSGTWQVNTAGYTNLYLRMSNLASGTTTVSIIQSTASARGGSGGGGGGAALTCSTTGGIAFETSANNLGCNSQLLWDNSNILAYTGVPQSTFEASYQNWLGTNPAKLWVTNEMGGTQFNTAFFQMEGLAATNPIGIWNSIHAHNSQPETYFGEIFGEVDNGQTVGSSVNLNLSTVWHGPGTVTQHKDVLASPNYTDNVVVTNSYGVWANMASSVGSTITNHYDFYSAAAANGATLTNTYGYYAEDHGNEGAGTFAAAFFAAAQSVGAHNWAFFNATGKSRFNALNYDTLATVTACAANGTAANPSVVSCGNNSAGMFSCSATASTGTCQVNTTVVTANSLIFITQDQADGGAGQLNVTCNTGNVLNTTKPLLVSKAAGSNFIINLGTVTANPACFEFHIVN